MSLRVGSAWHRGVRAALVLVLWVSAVRLALPVPGGRDASAAFHAQTTPSDSPPGDQQAEAAPTSERAGQITSKQRREILKADFEKMRRDGDELITLAKALQEDLSKTNENVLSLRIVEKAEKIERLARRIKSTARGY